MAVIETLLERRTDWFQALLEHLQLSLLALTLAMLLAIPLGILLSQNRRAKEVLLQVTGIFQTIPSLALLGLFIPFTGIGTLPALLALIIYALFPMLQATVTGLAEIDPSLNEAATAFGMTRWEKLKTYQLALALPVMMAGVRTAGIMIIGTATLAALVGAGGLGSFILLGIDRHDSNLILLGALSSAFLALLFGALLNSLSKRKPRQLLMVFLSLFLAVSGSYLPSLKPQEENKLVIAGKLGAEPEIIINMYKLLIEDRTELTVEVKPNFGKTSFLYEALKNGSIDIYPEYTGTVTTALLEEPIEQVPTDAQAVYDLARQEIFDQDGLIYLSPTEFQNTYALAVTEAAATENQLATISDLIKLSDTIRAGFSLEFHDRPDGTKGLQDRYGLHLDVKTMEPSLKYQAIKTGDVELIEVYSTDSQIITNQLKVLEDDKQLFPPYQAAPLMRGETLATYPELEEVLSLLAGKITSEEMAAMNYQVDVDGQSALEVAKAYLEQEGLLK